MDILIVDDDADTREILGMILRAEGHHVEEAADGIDALERLQGGDHPSLILLDMMMPRLDGEGLMRAMKREPAVAGTPVYILSGHQSVGAKADELGASGYLTKPIDLDKLLTVLRETRG